MMVKASEGGGGKGIRKVLNENELELALQQVMSEVRYGPTPPASGSPSQWCCRAHASVSRLLPSFLPSFPSVSCRRLRCHGDVQGLSP